MDDVHTRLRISGHLPRTKDAPVQDTALTAPAPTRSPEEEARDILAAATKNQTEDGPNTRRAAVRVCKYLRAMVNQYESTIHEVHLAARTHTQMSKGTAGTPVDYRPQGGVLPIITPELTSELLHCLSTLLDPWLLAKITIDMEKLSQWVSKLCDSTLLTTVPGEQSECPRLHMSPTSRQRSRRSRKSSQSLTARMIEFLAEWLVTVLIPATHVLEVRAPHLSFMLLKEYCLENYTSALKSQRLLTAPNHTHES